MWEIKDMKSMRNKMLQKCSHKHKQLAKMKIGGNRKEKYPNLYHFENTHGLVSKLV